MGVYSILHPQMKELFLQTNFCVEEYYAEFACSVRIDILRYPGVMICTIFEPSYRGHNFFWLY